MFVSNIRRALLLSVIFTGFITSPINYGAEALESYAEESVRQVSEFTISRESFDNPLVLIETNMGDIVAELFPDEAPLTVTNFLGLAEGTKAFIDPYTQEEVMRPFYDGTIFHRVVNGFMIQGGSPTGLGDGGPGYEFRDEINARSLGLDRMQALQENGAPHPFLGISDQSVFQRQVLVPLYEKMGINSREELEERVDEVYETVRNLTVKDVNETLGYKYTETVLSRMPVTGVLAMANAGPATNGSQFFINLTDTPWLAGKHTVFGKVRAGMDVVEAIGKVQVDSNSRPVQNIQILSVRQLQE